MILDSKWGFLRSGNWLVRVSCALHVPYTWQARVFVFLISKKPLHKILWTLFLPGYYRQNIIFTKYRSLMSTEKRNKKYGLRCFVKCKKFKKKHRLLPSTLGLSFYKKISKKHFDDLGTSNLFISTRLTIFRMLHFLRKYGTHH